MVALIATLNADAQAFPSFNETGETRMSTEGLTKREYVATQICAGLVGGIYDGDAAKTAVKIADRLLEELARGKVTGCQSSG